MLIGIPRETAALERRVAATPDSVGKLVKLGFTVQVEAGAGSSAGIADSAYEHAGAKLAPDAATIWRTSELLLKVQPPSEREVEQLREGATLVSLIWPARNQELVQRLAARKATVLAMDCVPRISRAQKLDVLSSMANIAGYRAVVEAAAAFGGFFTGQITAAGRVPPAKVLVIGAGVAGLAAVGAARGLGAIVRAFDTRLEVREQVKSMGAEFLELAFKEDGSGGGGYAKVMSPEFIRAEMELFAKQAREVDIIITTALVPGVKAPTLITADMVRSMRPGGVVVDLAAEQGGNCELTKPGQLIQESGVTIIGYTDLASRLPATASSLYANNLVHLFSDLCRSGTYVVDAEDEVVRGMLVLDHGQLRWPPPKKAQQQAAGAPAGAPAGPAGALAASKAETSAGRRALQIAGFWSVAGLLLALTGAYAPESFLSHLTVFVLACFIGWQVIWNVNPALHTPLMSVTNAISGIIVVGAMLQMRTGGSAVTTALAALAVLVATINIAGGFLVTQRMLRMFRKEAR
jgi:NAD(P) transhydrogenase subunit alpha